MNLFKPMKLHAVAPILALTLGGFAGTLAAGNEKMTISAGKLARDAKDFYGKTVTVRAEVEDVFDSRSFTLDEDTLFAGPDVLVLVPSGMAADLRKDQVVMVTGTVRPYVTTELERDYDWFKKGRIVISKTDVDFKTRPVLVATSLRTAEGRDLLLTTGETATMRHEKHGMKAHEHAMEHPATFSAGELAKHGKKHFGQRVTVRAEVEDLLDTHSFTLDEDATLTGADVVVLVPAGFDISSLSKDDIVTVTGTVRPYVVADLERDFDWFKGGKIVSMGTKVDYKTRPVVVAESIMTSSGRDLLLVSR
jgi:hypothetical protein